MAQNAFKGKCVRRLNRQKIEIGREKKETRNEAQKKAAMIQKKC